MALVAIFTLHRSQPLRFTAGDIKTSQSCAIRSIMPSTVAELLDHYKRHATRLFQPQSTFGDRRRFRAGNLSGGNGHGRRRKRLAALSPAPLRCRLPRLLDAEPSNGAFWAAHHLGLNHFEPEITLSNGTLWPVIETGRIGRRTQTDAWAPECGGGLAQTRTAHNIDFTQRPLGTTFAVCSSIAPLYIHTVKFQLEIGIARRCRKIFPVVRPRLSNG